MFIWCWLISHGEFSFWTTEVGSLWGSWALHSQIASLCRASPKYVYISKLVVCKWYCQDIERAYHNHQDKESLNHLNLRSLGPVQFSGFNIDSTILLYIYIFIYLYLYIKSLIYIHAYAFTYIYIYYILLLLALFPAEAVPGILLLQWALLSPSRAHGDDLLGPDVCLVSWRSQGTSFLVMPKCLVIYW